MDNQILAALIGLGGTLIAALIGLGGTIISLRNQKRDNKDLKNSIGELLNSKSTTTYSSKDFKIYNFTDDDLELQKARIKTAKSIQKIIRNGIDNTTREQINQIAIHQHNSSLKYKRNSSNLEKHLEEIELMYDILRDDVIESPTSNFKADAITAIGVMTHNMKGMTK